MLVSKIWVVLLTAAAVAGLAIARLVPNPAAREIAKAYADNLDRGQHNAELILRLEARDWIDAVAKMAWDGTIIDLLEQASNRRGDLKGHQSRLAARLLQLVSNTRGGGPQLMIAVDHRGKQIARIGPGEESFTPGEDGLAGYPLVEAALRGYRTDDTWHLRGRLLLMSASPVISRSHGRYVGALLVGLEMNDAFARRLKSRLAGTELAFFVRGKLVASTVRAEGIETLPEQFQKRSQEIVKHGRSAVIRLGRGGSAHTAILAALPGEAGEHEAFYAAVGAPVPAVGLAEMLGMVSGGDLRWSEFPWPLLCGLFVIAAAIGLALLWWEHDAPLRRLLVSADKLGRGEGTRLDEYASGRVGRLAHAINEANEKIIRRGGTVPKEGRPPTPEPRAPIDLGAALAASGNILESSGVRSLGSIADIEAVSPPMAILDPAASEDDSPHRGGPSHRERAALSLGLAEEPEDLGGTVPSDLLGSPPIEIPALNLTVTPSRPSAPGLAAIASSSGMAASSFDLEPQLGAPRPQEPPRAVGATTATGLRPVRLPESEEAALAAAQPSVPVAPPRAKPPRPEPKPEPRPSPPPPGPPATQEDFDTLEPTPVVSISAEDEYYRQVFKDFLAVKQQCGESTTALTFERFVDKLRKNKETLVKTYSCKSVKFQVYVKDGKAALKATPVRD